ncbi:hypothetical protein SDC9_137314 [bioreactor metagenome]|uniref:HTH cro/C1-type domain-containing protein n=1 Tax=bioreactor metagenome TaxID=1076179 RepID=A0A645DLN7_9ZZZZ
MREWLIEARGGRPQTEIANKSSISQQMYSAIERSEATPSVTVAKRLAKIVGVDWRQFYEDDRNPSHG